MITQSLVSKNKKENDDVKSLKIKRSLISVKFTVPSAP